MKKNKHSLCLTSFTKCIILKEALTDISKCIIAVITNRFIEMNSDYSPKGTCDHGECLNPAGL